MKYLALTKQFDLFIMLCVFLNTIILAVDGYIETSDYSIFTTLNITFTIIFGIEMLIKIIGFGLVDYFRDRINDFDAVIVILSIVELAISSESNTGISAFRAVRIFRV